MSAEEVVAGMRDGQWVKRDRQILSPVLKHMIHEIGSVYWASPIEERKYVLGDGLAKLEVADPTYPWTAEIVRLRLNSWRQSERRRTGELPPKRGKWRQVGRGTCCRAPVATPAQHPTPVVDVGAAPGSLKQLDFVSSGDNAETDWFGVSVPESPLDDWRWDGFDVDVNLDVSGVWDSPFA
jgi:hypothetical protein